MNKQIELKERGLDLKKQLFDILMDYGDFFLTNYPKQAETKSIHPTIERIEKVIRKVRQEAVNGEREKLKHNIGLLRQWLNEREDSTLITNAQLEVWLLTPKGTK